MKCRLYVGEISVGTEVCDSGLFHGDVVWVTPLKIDFCVDNV